MNQGRRNFFGDLLRQGAQTVAAFREGLGRDKGGNPADDFFDFYESSYALTLCEEELMLESARLAGIETQGRDRLEIAKELFARQDKEH